MLAVLLLLLLNADPAAARDPGVSPTDSPADTDLDPGAERADTDLDPGAERADTDLDPADSDTDAPPPAPPVVRANPAPPPVYAGPTLVVGVKSAPPFAFQAADGRWQGVSVELWASLAEDAGIPWELRAAEDLDGLLDDLESGRIDVAAAALTVTAEREAGMDFSHPFYDTGYGIAVRRQVPGLGYLGWLLSPTFWRVVAGLFVLLLIVGALAWLVERKHNEQFGGTPLQGLVSGLWWSAATMTTVGYGDKAPATVLGRLLGLVWMFASIITISSFTAAITTSLTVSQLDLGITGPEDLPGAAIGTVARSTSQDWLKAQHLHARDYPDAEAALDALAEGELDAVVFDAPILRYLERSRGDRRIKVLAGTYGRQSYAFGLRDGFAHRETVNRAMLDRLERAWWRELLRNYVGAP